jgi:hypothetical protein
LWKHIFSFYYAKKDISVASMDDWKHAFALEVNEIPRELTCFYTKQSFKQDVLGYPLFYTINPRYDSDWIGQLHVTPNLEPDW